MWSADVLEVNPACNVTVHQIGSAKHRVLLADNFYRYPQRVAELALGLYYTESRAVIGSYPGARAMITLDTNPLIQSLSKLWGEPLRPFHAEYHPVIFSAIHMRDYKLTPWQRQPHIDQGITAMMYLNPEDMCSGGTGLYRHRPTGLTRVPIEVTPELSKLAQSHGISSMQLRTPDGYAEFLNTVLFNPEYAMTGNSYINDGNEYWELLYRIDMKPNRLVIFDGRVFHSQHIAPGQFSEFFRMNQILYFQGHD
ncbi:hypothetical protein YTPLAS18_03910 [Nitrospira sp.]|nr:hypothetical protein YTPLAS18_03910 [Nitrospira sp.]